MERRELLWGGAAVTAGAMLLPFLQTSSAQAQTQGWSQVRDIGNTLTARTRVGLTQSDIYQVDIRKMIGILAQPSTNPSVVDLIENYYVLEGTESSTYVRFEDPNLVYRSSVENTAGLRAKIPLLDLTLANEQRAIVTVKQSGVVFTDKPPSMAVLDRVVPENYPGADNLRWIQGVSLWMVTIDLFSRNGGGGLFRWVIELGGERYRKTEETQAFPLMTVNAPKVFPFGRAAARTLIAQNPTLQEQPITAVEAEGTRLGQTRSSSVMPAVALVPPAVLQHIRAPAPPALPTD